MVSNIKYDLFLLFSVKYLGSSLQKASVFTSSSQKHGEYSVQHIYLEVHVTVGAFLGQKKNPIISRFYCSSNSQAR
jgi:hypothetical protein